jgi:HlyD family secretion protein
MAKQDFDAKKAAYDTAVATISQMQATVVQSKAQTESQRARVNNAVAQLRFNEDALSKTVSVAPFDGIVTNLPVREGETVVVGIQNAEGSTLMTIADMSVVTAEVKVDETDIVNVKSGQPADVTIDAIPNRVFKGHVTLVGDQALLRSSGVATSQSTTGTEEAKDFKVVVTLDQPDEVLRPGLSTTAKITTAHKDKVLSLPIQALTIKAPDTTAANGNVQAASTSSGSASSNSANLLDQQGVYVLSKDKQGKLRAHFVLVKTGITGATDIEILSGLKEGDEIVTGPYKTLRGLKENSLLKRDTAKPVLPAPNNS